jgi:nitrogen fixation-related uncharacterized protein
VKNTRTARILIALGSFILAVAPSPAFAHDNLGGDELAVANWMLVGALVTIVIGILWWVWAARNGQFTDIESSKYTMLDTAEDFDTIMSEYEAQDRAARATESAASDKEKVGARPAPAEPAVATPSRKSAHV